MYIEDIDIDDLIAEVKKIAAANPDHIYTDKRDSMGFGQATCFYERNGKPSCIMGQALHTLGVPIEELMAFDTTHQGSIVSLLTKYGKYDSHDEYGEDLVSKKLVWLNDVQYLQDTLKPWGVAVESAYGNLVSGGYNL
ncbi:hypothetical protein SEA_WEASELS2_208 [Rhodococcus phage Weasels2]|uniref:Uncharacterized protein n=1 Tax=Rhodococcus phage Weasels2 TaxID=1897437 RepID=A0A1I9SAI0_9CAUD|nr:hypothetical protein FDH04_gp208 [Rhodococcus phage Weasels2]AOZ63786.1 hypothetical protein SEA_WEASELS2_208 [Rhodococcus phage Weasels2]